jgi:hypothetical protein
MVQGPVVAAIVQIEAAGGRTLIVEVVSHKDLGRAHQSFPPKRFLQTTVGIVFLERNMDFHQLTCSGYEHSKSYFA